MSEMRSAKTKKRRLIDATMMFLVLGLSLLTGRTPLEQLEVEPAAQAATLLPPRDEPEPETMPSRPALRHGIRRAA